MVAARRQDIPRKSLQRSIPVDLPACSRAQGFRISSVHTAMDIVVVTGPDRLDRSDGAHNPPSGVLYMGHVHVLSGN